MSVNKLALGTAGFGNEYQNMTLDQCKEIITKCLENGITYFDTAPHYGKGKSEIILGKCIKDIDRNKFRISTKVGRVGNKFDYSSEEIIKSINRSLERLNLEYFDIVFVHDIEFAKSLDYVLEITIPTLLNLKKKGIIKNIGISGLYLDKLDYLISNSEDIDYILSYCCYTLLNNTLEKYVDKWTKKSVKIIQGGVTSMGLLTEQGPQSWHPASKKIKKRALDLIHFYKENNLNIVEYAFHFTNLSYNRIENILVGVTNINQLEQYLIWNTKKISNLSEIKTDLSDELW